MTTRTSIEADPRYGASIEDLYWGWDDADEEAAEAPDPGTKPASRIIDLDDYPLLSLVIGEEKDIDRVLVSWKRGEFPHEP